MGRNDKIKCAVVGVLAGSINGFFGAGCGTVVLPLLRCWVKVGEREEYAGSVAIILPLCAVSLAAYALRGDVPWRAAVPYLLGGTAGGFLGGRIFKKIPPEALRRAFALLLILGGLWSFFK